jgi:hypothetical protein
MTTKSLLLLTLCVACVGREESGLGPQPWRISPLATSPRGFRPGGWSDEDVLWGLLRGRVTRLNTRTGETRTLAATGWAVQAAPGVATWHNETGTWLTRDSTPTRLFGPDGDPSRRGEGPSLVFSPDGARTLVGWQHEWDAQYDLLERDGSRRSIETRIPGYYLNAAVLWLDSNRVLFQTVATGPVGGEPSYRESGWRGDLAVLDLRNGAYKLVTRVPDYTYLRVAGRHLDDVLVTEWDTAGVRGHWLYNANTWQRRTAALPKGRAFGSAAGAVVVLIDRGGDSTDAVLIAGGDTTALGRVARDAEPVFSPSGRRGAIHTTKGVVVLEVPH